MNHKFLIINGDSEFVMNWLSPKVSDEVRKSISYNEEPYLKVIECRHEEFRDNVVSLEDDNDGGVDFVRDINGKLFYFADYWRKTDVIDAFE